MRLQLSMISLRGLSGLSVSFRLGLLVAISVLTLCAVGTGGWLGINRVGASVMTLQDERLPAAMLIGEIRSASNQLLQLSFEILMREKQANAQSKFAQTLTRKEALLAALDKAMDDYDKLPKSDEEGEAWKNFKDSMTPWKASNAELSKIIKELADNDDPDKQVQLFGAYKAPLASWGYTQARVELNLTSLLALNKDEVEKTRQADTRIIALATRFMGGTLAVSVVILLALGLLVVRSITGSIGRLRALIVNVASDNDFTQRASAEGQNEIAQTARAFNGLLDRIQTSLRAVLGNAQGINAVSDRVSQAAHRGAESAGHQNEAASAMAAAVEELTVSITHINESMHDTLGGARGAGQAADDGAAAMTRAKDRMDAITSTVERAGRAIEKLSRESTSIATILQVIKDVADQTNLLALNAAIEAARAGEQGRGFAVVADEVRKLAERTTASTKAIEELVASMQANEKDAVAQMETVNSEVAAGRHLSTDAHGHIQAISHSSRQVVTSIGDISAAIDEQSTTAQEIAQRVEVVARLSEANTQTAQETAEISSELEVLSSELRAAISAFRI